MYSDVGEASAGGEAAAQGRREWRDACKFACNHCGVEKSSRHAYELAGLFSLGIALRPQIQFGQNN